MALSDSPQDLSKGAENDPGVGGPDNGSNPHRFALQRGAIEQSRRGRDVAETGVGGSKQAAISMGLTPPLYSITE